MEKRPENLDAGKSEAKRKTTHNVCSRQLMDDANRLKCSKCQWEEIRLPFDDQKFVEQDDD